MKLQWVVATLCCSLCLTQVLVMLTNFHLNALIWSLPVLTLSLPLNPLYGAQTPKTLSKTSQLLGSLETISTVLCSSKEIGIPTKKQSAALTRRVVARMKRLQLISHNETVSCTCMKCVLTEMDTQTKHYWTF